MSIIVKGIEMPKSCGDCPFVNKFDNPYYYTELCSIKKKKIKDLDSRQDWCPIIECPPTVELKLTAEKLRSRYQR